MTLFWFVMRKVLGAFAAAFLGVMTIYLAVDFVDNAHVIRGSGWFLAALELYLNKAAVVANQIAPAAMVLGSAIAVSGLRQSREWTALRSVGLGPWRVALPALAAALLVGGTLLVLHDAVGVAAAERVEEIQATRFRRGASYDRWKAWHTPKRWFRGADGRRIYYLRGTLPGGGFESVTVLEVTPEFRLARRLDAQRMTPAPGGAWRLEALEERTFLPDGSSQLVEAPWREERFDEPPGSFDVAPGRPSQLRWAVLTSQIELRRRLGQPTSDFVMERANRLAYPLTGVPGALLAVVLALRRQRRGHLSSALVEAVGISLLLWAAQGVTWAFGLSGRLPAEVAAWSPIVLFAAAASVALRRVV